MIRSATPAHDLQDNLLLVLTYHNTCAPAQVQALVREVLELHPADQWALSDLQQVFDQVTDAGFDLGLEGVRAVAAGLCSAHDGALALMACQCTTSSREAYLPARGAAFRRACTAAAATS